MNISVSAHLFKPLYLLERYKQSGDIVKTSGPFGNEYFAIRPDGSKRYLGIGGQEDHIESWLSDHRTPETW